METWKGKSEREEDAPDWAVKSKDVSQRHAGTSHMRLSAVH